MAQPAQHVARTRAAITRLTDAAEAAIGCLGEYQWLETVPGTVGKFFYQPDGVTPRTDYDLTEAQYEAVIEAIGELRVFINSGTLGADLYRAKG